MKVPINLASRPYENLRPFYNAAGLAATLLVALALVVGWNYWQNRRDTRLLTEQSNQLEREMADLRREQRELEQWLGRPEVQEIRDRSAFLNSLIMRKSLSWTQMFMDLEQILPGRAQVTAIRPHLNQSQQVEVNLAVAAASMAPLVEFLKKLEAAPQFGSPVLHSRRASSGRSAEGDILLELSVLYHQVAPGQTSSAEVTRAPSAEKSAALANASPRRLPKEEK